MQENLNDSGTELSLWLQYLSSSKGWKMHWEKVPAYGRCRKALVYWLAKNLLLVFCLFSSQLSGNSEAWSSTGSKFEDFRLMVTAGLVEHCCSQIDCSEVLMWFHQLLLLWSAMVAMRYQRGEKAGASKGSYTVIFESWFVPDHYLLLFQTTVHLCTQCLAEWGR